MPNHQSHTKSTSQIEMMEWGFNSTWQQLWKLLNVRKRLQIRMISKRNLTL